MSVLNTCISCYGQRPTCRSPQVQQALEQALRTPGYRKLYATAQNSGAPQLLDFHSLPFLTPAHIVADPLQFATVPLSELARVYTTSGTTGVAKLIFLSDSDVELLVSNICHILRFAGVGRGSVLIPLLSYGPTAGAVEVVLAARRLGATVTPVSIYTPENLLALFPLVPVTHVFSLPAALRALVLRSAETRQLLRADHLIVGGEILTRTGKELLAAGWKATAVHEVYGSMELFGLGHRGPNCIGFHPLPGYGLIEICDPVTRRAAGPLAVGEVIVTAVGRHAMPLIRYRIGDLAVQLDRTCPCGTSEYTFVVLGRADESFIAGGAFVFPHEIRLACQAVGADLGVQVHSVAIRIQRDHLDRDIVGIGLTIPDAEPSPRLSELFSEHLAKHNPDFAYACRTRAVLVRSAPPQPPGTVKLRIAVTDQRSTGLLRELRPSPHITLDRIADLTAPTYAPSR